MKKLQIYKVYYTVLLSQFWFWFVFFWNSFLHTASVQAILFFISLFICCIILVTETVSWTISYEIWNHTKKSTKIVVDSNLCMSFDLHLTGNRKCLKNVHLLDLHIKTIIFLFYNYVHVFNSSQKWLNILVQISYFLCWSIW
jgi:hypothetical protein